jgi:peptidyl-prolyl cis-trans isomerase B (cyclophilin B)
VLIPFHLLLVVAIAGCGESTEAPPVNSAGSVAPVDVQPPAEVDQLHPVVKIETNLGAITIRLDAESVPLTVQNFLNYVNEGFYKNTIFHYVDADQMIMGGGYSIDHQLKPARSTIRNEAHKGPKNLRGTIAMARNPALLDSANSQFFINLQDAPQRDYTGDSPETYGYCVFGEVIEGLDVAERISRSSIVDKSNLASDLAQTPETPVIISTIQRL